MKFEALRHAQDSYEAALRKFTGAELQPFRQNYANILRQFGLTAKAARLEAATPQEGGE